MYYISQADIGDVADFQFNQHEKEKESPHESDEAPLEEETVDDLYG